jgi:tetratricopeptide (TPR) repeat protein
MWTAWRSSGAGIVGLALLVAGGACAPVYGDAFLASFAAGERALHAGRYVEAARAYDEAAGKALRVKDRDEARFLEARCLEKADRWQEARATYQRLAAESPTGPRAARAAFELADLEIAHGDVEKGYAQLGEAAARFPQTGVARPTIHRIVAHIAEVRGEPAARAWLAAHADAFRGTDEDQAIGYEIARSLEREGKKQEAHDALLASARAHPYPKGGLTDDALVHAAKIDEELGRWAEAVEHLRDLLATQEVSHAIAGKYDMASYERPRFPEAALRIAEIYRDALHDHAAARKAFEAFYRDHPKARKRDLALWSEGRLALEDGEPKVACELASRLASEFPESRYTPCARTICPSAPAAKRECADYILRAPGSDATDATEKDD